MFAIMDKIHTGRREYDDEDPTTSTVMETRYISEDIHTPLHVGNLIKLVN